VLEEHDERARRCPRLGHHVPFRYCRTQEGGRLCLRILDCWWETFDVRGFLEAHGCTQELERIAAHEPADKLMSILELVERVRPTRRGPQG
jgi:hypothetical protein